jgi:hypothetical protein
MARPCSACRSAQVARINRMLGQGLSFADIGRKVSLAPEVISRHARHAFRAPTDAPASSREQQIALWQERAESLYLAATNRNDLRAQVATMQTALKMLEMDKRRGGELKPDAVTNVQVNVSQQQPELPPTKLTEMCVRWLRSQGWKLEPPALELPPEVLDTTMIAGSSFEPAASRINP